MRRRVGVVLRSVVAFAIGLVALPVTVAVGAVVVAGLAQVVFAIVAWPFLYVIGMLTGNPFVAPWSATRTVGGMLGLQMPRLWGGVGLVVTIGVTLVVAVELHAAAVEDTREPSDDERWVVDTVERIARQVDVPAPTVRIAEDDHPVAYTTRYRGPSTLVVSRGLIDVLDREEVAAVLAHEVAHVVNGDLRTATGFSLLAIVTTIPGVIGMELLKRGAIPGIVPFLLWMVQLGLVTLAGYLYFPAREFAADAAAAAITGNPAALASAIETLDDRETPTTDPRETDPGVTLNVVDHPDSLIPVSHPSVERRLERLRERAREQDSGGG